MSSSNTKNIHIVVDMTLGFERIAEYLTDIDVNDVVVMYLVNYLFSCFIDSLDFFFFFEKWFAISNNINVTTMTSSLI